MRTRAPLTERIASNSDRSGGCWIWLLRLDRHGYGRINVAGKAMAAHRVAYTAFVGPIPDGLVIDHLCRNRACVNPSHLEPVSSRENSDRGLRSATKTHCVNGHEFTDDNTYVHRNRRNCRACNRERVSRYQARRAGANGERAA